MFKCVLLKKKKCHWTENEEVMKDDSKSKRLMSEGKERDKTKSRERMINFVRNRRILHR